MVEIKKNPQVSTKVVQLTLSNSNSKGDKVLFEL